MPELDLERLKREIFDHATLDARIGATQRGDRPALWDALRTLTHEGDPRVAQRARYALALALIQSDLSSAGPALQLLEGLDIPCAVGLRMYWWAILGHYAHVRAEPFRVLEIDARPDDAMNACLGLYALALAETQTDHPAEGLVLIGRAISKGEALGVRYRLLNMRGELERTYAQIGHGDVHRLQRLSADPDMSEAGALWAKTMIAEVLMGEGEYRQALAGLREVNLEPGLQAFLHALLGEDEPALIVPPDDGYAALAVQARSLHADRDVQVESPLFEPRIPAYAALFTASRRVLAGELSGAAAALGTTPPDQLDQRLLWHFLHWLIALRGTEHPLGVLPLLQRVMDAARALKTPHEAVAWLFQTFPEPATLASYAADAHPAFVEARLSRPLMVGNHVRLGRDAPRNRPFKLAGSKIGLPMVLAACGIKLEALNPTQSIEQRRFRERLVELGISRTALVNMGAVMVLAERMALHLRHQGLLEAEAEWLAVAAQVRALLDPEVRRRLDARDRPGLPRPLEKVSGFGPSWLE